MREFRSREMTLRERWLDTYRHSMRLLIATKAPYRDTLVRSTARQRILLCSIVLDLFNESQLKENDNGNQEGV